MDNGIEPVKSSDIETIEIIIKCETQVGNRPGRSRAVKGRPIEAVEGEGVQADVGV